VATQFDDTIRFVLGEARRVAGGASVLAARLRESGVGPEHGYSESAISNWVNGRTMPPADVLLAAASLFGLPIDEVLGNEGDGPYWPGYPTDEQLGQLRSAVDKLQAQVDAQLGQPEDRGAQDVRDLRAVFASSSEVNRALPQVRSLAASSHVDAMGIGAADLLVQIARVTLAELVSSGLVLRLLLLDPDSEAGRARDAELRRGTGTYARHANSALEHLASVRELLPAEFRSRIQVRTYDETPFFDVTIYDSRRALVQLTMPKGRHVDQTKDLPGNHAAMAAPAFLIEADRLEPRGLFPIFQRVFDLTWEYGRAVPS
jgi:transcriptional regulator with XRE-family HTH domain